jgi:VIT1/CCC1 family predicted Fe2+/Mn2+ transporter
MSLTKSIDNSINKTFVPNSRNHTGSYLKSAVYGGLDGVITTFAVVAGVAGASLSAGIVLIMGFANLIADGISMAIGDYLSTKSEREYDIEERRKTEWAIENRPGVERTSMKDLYTKKGFSDEDTNKMLDIMEKNKAFYTDTVMMEEHGIVEFDGSPFKNAIVTFSSFVFFGFVPLLVYVVSLVTHMNTDVFLISIVLTGLTLFILGVLKAKFTSKNFFTSGMEMLIIGGIAAGAAYLIGYWLSALA